MKKIALYFYVFIFISGFSPQECLYAESSQEIFTSQGKVITGLTKEEALGKFGVPESIGDNIWSYLDPGKFFVYFSKSNPVYLYPKFCTAQINVPLELKAFVVLPDSKINNITHEVELVIDPSEGLLLKGPGIIVPKKAGKYQIFGKYAQVLSNPVEITVEKQAESREKLEKEKLLSIDVFPYRPKASTGSQVYFVALGTFLNTQENKYSVRYIGNSVSWFVQQNGKIEKSNTNQITFSRQGIYKVFCRFQNVESYPQRVEIVDLLMPAGGNLKHLAVLPEFMLVPAGSPIEIKAFASYFDNRFSEVNSEANWRIKDGSVLSLDNAGNFKAQSEGVTEVTAELNGVESLPAKVIVVKKDDSSIKAVDLYTAPSKPKDPMEEIKKNAQNLSENILLEKNKLKFIKIIPENLKIHLGDKAEFSAKAVYDDNSEKDVTKISNWESLNNKIIAVILGKVSTLSTGQTSIYAELDQIKSLPALITVEEPDLVSMFLSPREAKITMADKLQLKVEGYFSDSSHKDITALASWNITGPHIIKVEKGQVTPSRIGQTKVNGEYSGIKSLPSSIKVVFTLEWFLWMVLKVILILILFLIMVFLILYSITAREKKRLLALYKIPKEFIISLSDNLRKILEIFDLKYEGPIAPLLHAELIEEKLAIKNRVFLKFTVKFEEAKYSHHILQTADADAALENYNNFIKLLFAKHGKFSLFIKYCSALFHRKPLFLKQK